MDLVIDLSARSRKCGSCTLCCKLVPVATLQKKAGQRCKHQSTAKGCAIYAHKPIDCSVWSCRWLADPRATGMKRPDRSHYVIDPMPDTLHMRDDITGEVRTVHCLQVWCDTAFPDAWRDPALMAFIEDAADRNGMPTLIRHDNKDGIAVFAPSLSADGKWNTREGIRPNPNLGRYSTLLEHERPPL